VGGDRLDRGQDRVRGADPDQLGEAGRTRFRRTGGFVDRGARADDPKGGVANALEREVRELRQANEILRKASAYSAQAELDRRFKP
jgi:hypothetical protein